ncbi:MAG: hypothetical protein ACXQS3_03725 [Candidatus Methanofastidiosia archaeon]
MEEKIKLLHERIKIYNTQMQLYEHTTNEYLNELKKIHADVTTINKEIQQMLTMIDKEINK